MSKPPEVIKLYHITHIDNLRGIATTGALYSDTSVVSAGLPYQNIGLTQVKRNRRTQREVTCHKGTNVGDYVPFNFCPRSVMLYILHKANYRDLEYRAGQDPIIHLQFDLNRVVEYCGNCSLAKID